MKPALITSLSNSKVKDLVRLKDRKGEWAERCFLVEGQRELKRAVSCRFVLNEILLCPEIFEGELPTIAGQTRLTQLSAEVFAKIATRDGSDGILGVFETPKVSQAQIEDKIRGKASLLVAVENVEKPGNLGAILRTADGAGVDAVITLNRTVDPWNPHVIRASLGGVFSVPVFAMTSQSFVDWCKKMEIQICAAALTEGACGIYSADFTPPTALVFGTEAFGLSELLVSNANRVFKIPMAGICDSLNVSVAAAVAIYEAVRQRSKN